MASTSSGGEREREELQQEIAQIKQALQDEDDSEEEEEEEEAEWVEGFGSDPEPAAAVSVQFDNNSTTATDTRETFETATVQEFESQGNLLISLEKRRLERDRTREWKPGVIPCQNCFETKCTNYLGVNKFA